MEQALGRRKQHRATLLLLPLLLSRSLQGRRRLRGPKRAFKRGVLAPRCHISRQQAELGFGGHCVRRCLCKQRRTGGGARHRCHVQRRLASLVLCFGQARRTLALLCRRRRAQQLLNHRRVALPCCQVQRGAAVLVLENDERRWQRIGVCRRRGRRCCAALCRRRRCSRCRGRCRLLLLLCLELLLLAGCSRQQELYGRTKIQLRSPVERGAPVVVPADGAAAGKRNGSSVASNPVSAIWTSRADALKGT